MSKITESGGSFGSWLDCLGKKVLRNSVIPLAKYNLSGLVSNSTSSSINKFERKISRKEQREQEKDLLYLLRMKIRMILLKS